MNGRAGQNSSLFASIFLFSLLLSACSVASESGLFAEADYEFVLDDVDHLDCLTGESISTPEYRLTRAGLGWQRGGEGFNILLEYGGIDEIHERTNISVGFIDHANPPIEISDPHPRSIHSRASIFAELSWSDKNRLDIHFWLMDERGRWIEPAVIRFGDEVEVRGNQARISVPAELLGVSGPSDPRVSDFTWVVVTGNEDEPDSCVEPETSWPLEIDALRSDRKTTEHNKRIEPKPRRPPNAGLRLAWIRQRL